MSMAIRFDRTLEEMSALLGTGVEAERAADADGWLQRRDPRAKLVAALILLLAAALVNSLAGLAALYLVTLAGAAASRLPMGRMLRREWLITALFTGVMAAPALFTAVTPGAALVRLPAGLAISEPGLVTASRLLLRAVLSIHIALTLTQSTPWHRVLRGLRGLGVPATAVMVLSMCHRYIYLLISGAREMLLGREARRVGRLSGAAARRQMAASVGALLLRSQETGAAVHAAMTARGYRGEPRDLRPLRWRARDWALCGATALLCIMVVTWDRAAR
jgi:cobalt ECF transporter T component CbiQ